MKILKCSSCKKYTLKKICSKCKENPTDGQIKQTFEPKPAKFSLSHDYKKYRVLLKNKNQNAGEDCN